MNERDEKKWIIKYKIGYVCFYLKLIIIYYLHNNIIYYIGLIKYFLIKIHISFRKCEINFLKSTKEIFIYT